MATEEKNITTYKGSGTLALTDKFPVIDVDDLTDGPDGSLVLATLQKIKDQMPEGDMTKSVYDLDDNGVVDNSEALGGQNSTYHLARANHTGEQAISTITDLQATLDGKSATVHTHLEADLTDLGEYIENIVEDTTPQLGGHLDSQNKDITALRTATFNGEVDNGNSGASKTIHWDTGQKQVVTLSDNCTITFGNPSGAGNFLLRIVQDGFGNRIITWPAGIKWVGGVLPTLTTDANGIDIASFYFDGTTYYGMLSLGFATV